MKKLIVVADWAGDSLTLQEFRSATYGNLTNGEYSGITFVASTPSTIHTSYLINQVVETEEKYGKPEKTIIFENTDPRIQTNKSVEKSRGADFILVLLKSGIHVCGPNAGFNFSMIKNKILSTFIHKNLDRGSQFRSRDLYSRVCACLMEGRERELDLTKVNKDIIPDVHGKYIGHVDNYGNIKTTIKLKDLGRRNKFGDKIEIKINRKTHQAKFVDNLFGGRKGELVIYPGSSGLKKNPYLEISVWRHFTEKEKTTGAHNFDNPLPGEKIEILSKIS